MAPKDDAAVMRWTDMTIRIAAGVVVTIAVSVLLGWVLRLMPLLAWGQHVPMRFNTALCLILASVGLLLVRTANSRRSLLVARFCGCFLSLVGSLTMLEHVFEWNLYIDQLLWTDTISSAEPGRMSAVTAAFLVVIGIFLITVHSSRRVLAWVAPTAAVIGALEAQWSIMDVLMRRSLGTAIAANTSIALLALCLGMFLAPSTQGFLEPTARNSSGGRLLRRLVPTVVLAPIALAWARWYTTAAGLLTENSGTVLLMTACTAALLGVIFWTANNTDAIDAQRERLAQELDGFLRLPLHSLLSIIGYDGRFRRISSSWTKMLGHSQEEILNTPYIEFVHPDDRQKTSEVAAAIGRGESVIAFENRYRTADGSYRWLSWNAIPTDKQAMYAIAEDITERKRVEDELRETSERLRLTIDGVKEHALYCLDTEGRVQTWNAGAERITGYSAAEMIGQPLTILYPPDVSAETLREELHSTIRNGFTLQHGWRVRKDGSRFFSEGSVASIQDHKGQLNGFVKIVHDVTARVEAEEKIRQLNEDLEERVRLRTAELAASNKELEAFAYSVSHDLRAPLRHLDGFLSLLRRRAYGQLDDSAKHYIDATMEASQRMGTLIDELLQFSRLGRSDLRTVEVDLHEVITEVRRELQPEIARRTVHWKMDALPHVMADRAMLRQVMQNLLGNALKFTRSRPETVISISAQTDHDGETTIRIADNGVGFDMQYYNKLFGVFQRLHSEDEFEGTGIGLANVRRIVERHSGRVWAESETGKGATFYFTLPCAGTEPGEKHDLIETHFIG